MATLLFLLTAIIYIWDNKYWWIAGLSAVAISQILIILYWKDAKFGTIANVIILFPLIISLFTARFNRETVNQNEKLYKALPNTGILGHYGIRSRNLAFCGSTMAAKIGGCG